jgi:hypothetical protein
VDHERLDFDYTKDRASSNAPVEVPGENVFSSSPLLDLHYSELNLSVLVVQCLREIDNYRKGDPGTDEYGLELLRRATIENNHEAWESMQYCFGGMVRGWLWRHPKRSLASRFESEENYIAQAFERFWQATTLNRRLEFRTLGAALQYLRACLNGVVLDTLRTYIRPGEVSLQESLEPGEPVVENGSEKRDVWDILQTMLSDTREQRLAYLLFHCGLKPREIVRFCPEEWSDVQEIYRLRRRIMERVLRNVDQLRWRLR